MTKPTVPKASARIRCAVYTRKSSEEGLQQEFNSLDAQRESAEAYIASMRHEGWTCNPERYDDGGFTGANIDRPAVKKLMADIEAGLVDCVVVYKVDRLSRSLLDFARLMELFERKKIAFVSVTQQFCTTQSMGRLTLNILLSFAQFEREIISERTRDKIAAARRKGKWSGGRAGLGYDVDPVTKKLVVNPVEAKLVREVFDLYLKHRSLIAVCRNLNGRGLTTKAVTPKKGAAYGGRRWEKPALLKVLTNVLYKGRVRHKAETFPGEQPAIVDEAIWDEVNELLRSNGRSGGMFVRNKYGALLKGLMHCKACGLSMGHSMTVKDGSRAYRYYVCYRAQKQGWDSCPCPSLPAEQIEQFVVEQIKRIGDDPDLRSLTLAKCREQTDAQRTAAQGELATLERDLARLNADLGRTAGDAATNAHAAARLAELHGQLTKANDRAKELQHEIGAADASEIGKDEVDAALTEFDGVWKCLSPKEQAELLRLLIQRVDYDAVKESVSITFHPLGLRSLGQRALAGELEEAMA